MSIIYIILKLYSHVGDLFIPVVTIVQNTISSLNFIITQPGISAICVRNYIIYVTSTSSGIQQSVIYVTNSSSTNVGIDNLQLCLYNYTVEVIAIDFSGNMSEPFMDTGNIALGGKPRMCRKYLGKIW